ncbi:uncharacterized protein si:ch211-276i12.4 [Antennarius striatus]|uniref:uncharacterized protein si:ch211-276i12.4 n=1 Tax=Antennarius striatus TaxID=241820 RepID=UPI0035B018B5
MGGLTINRAATDEIKPRKYGHRHRPHNNEDPRSHRNTMFDETDRNSIESHGHCHLHQHSHYIHDSPHHHVHQCHQTQQGHRSEEDEILYNHQTPVTLRRASSSSLSSSSSSSISSSSWHTEASANGPFSLCHAEQSPHSLSCSNIADIHRGFRKYDGSKPIVYATVKHGKNDSVFSELYTGSEKKVKHRFSSLDRGHSRSDEGLLHGNESDLGGERSRVQHTNYEPLFKTASLSRSLAFSEEDILLEVSRGPKRAVSSSQLPSKGILKNKETHPDIRKAKSMEVLSQRFGKGQDCSGQKTQVDIEQARANFVQEKLQFSAFLDEITKQVISPSDLTILGVNSNKATGKVPIPAQASGPIKPQLPPKKQRGNDREQHLKQQNRAEEAVCSSSRKHFDSHKLISYTAKNHRSSPSPHHRPDSPSHHAHNHKDKRLPPTCSFGSGESGMICGPHLTDCTSTDHEFHQPKQHYQHMQQPITSYGQHAQHIPKHHPQKAQPGSESSSTKSDSSTSRDTASTATSHSLDHRGQHSEYVEHSKQSRDSIRDGNYFRALQEENADLQQNLLQTIVCIESLEVELKRTRDELNLLKEKYKSLLETHAGTKQARNLLGEHLNVASVSLSSDRQYLLNRVSQLSTELEDAHSTIAALENVNVPCLIKELLEKDFSSAESVQKILMTPRLLNLPATSPQTESQFHAPKMEEATPDWTKLEADPEGVTAFIPFAQEVQTTQNDCVSGHDNSSRSPPFSVADISAAIYKNMAARYAISPQPLYPPSQQQSLFGTNHTDAPPNLPQAYMTGESLSGKGGEKATVLDEDVVDMTSVSAQQILDEFMRQLQAHPRVVDEKKKQSGQERVDEVAHMGKTAD